MRDFAVLLFYLSLTCLVVGLIKPKLVIRWGDDGNKKRGKVFLIYGIALVISIILSTFHFTIPFLSAEKGFSETKLIAETEESNTEWNIKDTNVISNGNIPKAIKVLFEIEDSDIQGKSKQIAASYVDKTPWKYYGQIIKFTGTAGRVIEYPPGSDFSKLLAAGGECGLIIIRTEDGIYVECIIIGSTGTILEGDKVTVYGKPVGKTEIEDESLGTLTKLIAVGKL